MFTSAYVIAFSAGLISFISPCIIPMITAYFSMITGMSVEELKNVKKGYRKQLNVIINTVLFIAAFTLVFTIAGGVAGKAASFINKNVVVFNVIGGIMVIFLAFKMLGIFKAVPLRSRKLEALLNVYNANTSVRYVTTFLVGVFFAVACSHCIGPVLYSMLIFAGSTGSSYSGMLIMFLFSMGLAVHYMLVGIFFNKSISVLQKVQKYHTAISYTVGSILLVFGILMLFNKFTLLVGLLNKVIPIRLPIGM